MKLVLGLVFQFYNQNLDKKFLDRINHINQLLIAELVSHQFGIHLREAVRVQHFFHESRLSFILLLLSSIQVVKMFLQIYLESTELLYRILFVPYLLAYNFECLSVQCGRTNTLNHQK